MRNLTAIRHPLNFTHAELTIRGTTPEGIEMEVVVGRILFKDPTDAAIIEVLEDAEADILVQPRNPDVSLADPRRFMMDLRGTMVPVDPAADGELFQVKVQEPEDLERMVVGEPEQDALFPAGWTDPKDWS